MISVIFLQFIYYIHSRKKLYIPGVTISTRSFDIGTMPNEGGTQIQITEDLIKDISQNTEIVQNGNFEYYVKEILPKLSEKIRFFPKAEQYLFLNRLNVVNTLKSIHNTSLINKNQLYSDLNKSNEQNINLYDEIKKSFFEFVKQNERRTTVGLGCLIKVAEKYGAKNLENYELLKAVKKYLKEIYVAQENMLEKEFFFINDIKDQLNEKKVSLYNITLEECYKTKYDNNSINWKDCIKDFEMNKLNLTSFEEFADAKNEFNFILHKNALLAQINIGIMIGCNGGINPDAGLSSYKGTYLNGSRMDGLTQNGYNLNFGFGFGNSRFDNMEPISDLLYYGKFKEYYLELRDIFNTMTKHYVFKDVANLGNVILNRVNHAKLKNITKPVFGKDMQILEDRILNNDTFTNSSIIIELKNKEPIDGKNSRIVYDDESVAVRKCEKKENSSVCYYRINNGSEITDESLYKIFNGIIGSYSMTNDSLDAMTFVLMYAQNYTDNDFYIKISIGNKSVEHDNATLTRTLNACFGVIYSGGKNDKDVCRNVFKETCGNELDYRCKESGLYDILTENPISVNDYPIDCSDTESSRCYNWINKNILGGGLVIRASVFGSLSLMLERYSQQNDVFNDDSVLLENEESEESEDNSDDFDDLDDLWKYVEKPKADINNDLNVALKKTVFYQVNQSLYLKIKNYIITIILFFLINI